jgi:hypothetical protein
MAPLLEDPRIRQTWNNISHNAETVTETAATGIWTFLHNYINPCFVSIGDSLNQCTTQCFPDREERARRVRERERTRGRAEYSFDFYDDWDDEQAGNNGGLLGWGNDELDRLLAGSGSHSHVADEQPSARKTNMSYGTRRAKRKSTMDGLPDPTIIPSTSALGFLQRLPFKIGGTLRYKPSAADLQDHPAARRAELGDDAEVEPLIDDDRSEDGDEGDLPVQKTRPRSSTTGSGDTSDSFRSRGDLFPSDGEDDAVPLSDEFAVTLERRNTLSGLDDRSSGKTRSSKGKAQERSRAISRATSRTSQSSSQSLAGLDSKYEGSATVLHTTLSSASISDNMEAPSLSELEQEEERVQREEEAELKAKREAAVRLAAQRGLSTGEIRTVNSGPDVPAAQDAIGNTPTTPQSTNEQLPVTSNTDEEVSESINEDARPSGSNGGTTGESAVPPDSNFVPARLPYF